MGELTAWTPKEIQYFIKLGDRVQQAQSVIPLKNDLPTAYIDPTLLAKLSSTDDPMEAAISLSFLEGFPSQNGLPFWERLENEPIEEYRLFQTYRDLPFQPNNTSGNRTITRTAELTGFDVRALTALAKMRHWRSRVSAFDYQRALERETRRLKEVEAMENHHAKEARRLFDVAMHFFMDHPDDMDGKTAIEALKLSAQLNRISLGLPGDKPVGEGGSSNGSGTVININAAQQNNINTDVNASKTSSNQKQDESRLFTILNILNKAGALPVPVAKAVTDVANSAASTNGEANATSTEVTNAESPLDTEVIDAVVTSGGPTMPTNDQALGVHALGSKVTPEEA